MQLETVTQQRKRIAKEMAAELSKPISISFEFMIDKEIRRIMEFDVKERILQSQTKFCWVSPCSQHGKHILQFEVSDGLFIDLIYTKKSNILNGGYDLFAAQPLPV